MSSPRSRAALLIVVSVLVAGGLAVLLLTRGGEDATTTPRAPAADPIAFVPPRADAVIDVDLRVPLVGVVFTQLLRQDAGVAVARAPLGARAVIAIRRGARWLAVQLRPGTAPRLASRGRAAVVGARAGVLVVAPTRAALATALAAAPTTPRTRQAARDARAAFERRLARLPHKSGARVAFAPRPLLARFDPRLTRTTWARNLVDGAAAVIVRGADVAVPFRLTSRATRVADLPVAPGATAPPTHGAAAIVAGLRNPGRTLDAARAAGLFGALDVLDRLPGLLKPDLHRLGRDGTITGDARGHVTVRLTPPNPGDWSRKLGRLDALSGLARTLGLADVRIDRRGDTFRIEQHGTFALRVAVVGAAVVLSDSQTADLVAAARQPTRPPAPDAAGALTIRIAAPTVLNLLATRLGTSIPPDLLTLTPLTGWLRTEPRVTAGELRIGVRR